MPTPSRGHGTQPVKGVSLRANFGERFRAGSRHAFFAGDLQLEVGLSRGDLVDMERGNGRVLLRVVVQVLRLDSKRLGARLAPERAFDDIRALLGLWICHFRAFLGNRRLSLKLFG